MDNGQWAMGNGQFTMDNHWCSKEIVSNFLTKSVKKKFIEKAEKERNLRQKDDIK